MIDYGYVAGIVDADGCITVWPRPSGKSTRIKLRVQVTDEDIPQRLQKFTKAGNVVRQEQHGLGTKPTFTWQVDKLKDTRRILAAIYPYMSARRQQKIEDAFLARGWDDLNTTDQEREDYENEYLAAYGPTGM